MAPARGSSETLVCLVLLVQPRTWFNAEIIKPDLSVFSLLLAPTARASQGLVLCLWPWLSLEQLSWDGGWGRSCRGRTAGLRAHLLGRVVRAAVSSRDRCPQKAKYISSSSCGHIPSWLLSNLPPKRRISLKAGLSCRCCASLCIAAHRAGSDPLQRCGCCCRCGCEPWSSPWLQGRLSPWLKGSLGLPLSMTRGLHLETASPGVQRDPSGF